tara:strand:- start:15 stop:488 length:474 start_codon:yes stop_codon:yes gene_type:complete
MVKMQCNGITAKGGRCQRQVTYSGWNIGEDGGLYCSSHRVSSHRVGYGYQSPIIKGPSLGELEPGRYVGDPRYKRIELASLAEEGNKPDKFWQSSEEDKILFSRIRKSLLIIIFCVVIVEMLPSFLDTPLLFIALYHSMNVITLAVFSSSMDPRTWS